MAAKVPVSVSALALPPTTTPAPLVAVRLPAGTLKVAVTLPLPASTSLKLMPLSLVATSSVTAILAGAPMVGVSLMAASTMVSVALLETPPLLSMALKLKLLLPLALAVGLKYSVSALPLAA